MCSMDLEIDPEHLKIVLRVLAKHLRPSEASVYVFGSRAKRTAKHCSDLDLAIESTSLPYSTILAIKSDFEDSLLPYTVDVVDLNKIAGFRDLIKNDLVKLDFAKALN